MHFSKVASRCHCKPICETPALDWWDPRQSSQCFSTSVQSFPNMNIAVFSYWILYGCIKNTQHVITICLQDYKHMCAIQKPLKWQRRKITKTQDKLQSFNKIMTLMISLIGQPWPQAMVYWWMIRFGVSLLCFNEYMFPPSQLIN